MLLVIRAIDSEVLRENEVLSIKIPTTDGSVQVLNNHAPMVGVIASGNITYLVNDQEKDVEISNGGIFSVRNNVVEILLSLHKF